MVYIEEPACIGCGKCVKGCPMGVLKLENRKAQVHPRRRCILCMHCAAGCPKQAVHFEELPDREIYPETPENPLERLLKTRRSIRHFSEKLPPRDLVEQALRTANFAPSGKNQRAYRWTVVWGKEQVQHLRDQCLALCAEYGEAPELVKLQALGTDLLTCGAPVMIVLHSPEDCLNPVLDPAVAMAQLELLLADQGLGTCWGGYLRQVSDRFPEIRKTLGVQENSRVRCALMVGYPQGEQYLRPVWRPAPDVTWLGE
jgi:nitroreductase/NAD-dependent dihydropyrimidine dehydrogenase PreA subunit